MVGNMSNIRASKLAMALSAFAIGGCAKTFEQTVGEAAADIGQFRINMVWAAHADVVAFERDLQQAKVGEILFLQDFVSTTEARLTDQISLKPIKGMFGPEPPTYTFNKGALFAEVLGKTRGAKVFCALAVTTPSSRACLIDRNDDGQFDYANWGFPSNANLFGVFGLTFPDTAISTSYELVNGETSRLMSIGIVFSGSAIKGYRLSLSSDNERQRSLEGALYHPDGLKPLEAPPLTIQTNGLPKTFEIGGAKIEISSIAGDVVTYRVISGFDPNTVMPIAYQGPLPSKSTN